MIYILINMFLWWFLFWRRPFSGFLEQIQALHQPCPRTEGPTGDSYSVHAPKRVSGEVWQVECQGPAIVVDGLRTLPSVGTLDLSTLMWIHIGGWDGRVLLWPLFVPWSLTFYVVGSMCNLGVVLYLCWLCNCLLLNSGARVPLRSSLLKTTNNPPRGRLFGSTDKGRSQIESMASLQAIFCTHPKWHHIHF